MSYNKGLVATLAELEAFYKGQDSGDVIELMNQTNDILSDVQFMESNQSDGHTTRIRTGLPDVHWRRLYRGIKPSKGKYAQVKEVCSMLESMAEIDLAEAQMYGDRAKAFRLSESMAHAEAMRQKVASCMFYGDNTKNSDEFSGFGMRYPTKTSPNVVDAGGTGSNLTSLWLISWGANTVHGIYPKGSVAGLETQDLGEQLVTDDDGGKFQALIDKHTWRVGIAVRDWRAVVRIANIDTTKLGIKFGETGYIDLQALTIEAKNKMPENMRGNAIWYGNQDILTGLEKQSIDPKGVHLNYGQFFGSSHVPVVHGRPMRQCDAILSTEKAV